MARQFRIRQLDNGRVKHDEPRRTCAACYERAVYTVRLAYKAGDLSNLMHYCPHHFQDVNPSRAARYWWHPFEGEYRPVPPQEG